MASRAESYDGSNDETLGELLNAVAGGGGSARAKLVEGDCEPLWAVVLRLMN
jgi:hypothetical protein